MKDVFFMVVMGMVLVMALITFEVVISERRHGKKQLELALKQERRIRRFDDLSNDLDWLLNDPFLTAGMKATEVWKIASKASMRSEFRNVLHIPKEVSV